MKPFYLYILKCNDESYYIGHTDDIDKRMCEHARGETPCYTKKRRPFKIMKIEEFPTRYEAMCAEKKLKKWTRAKKEAYINNNWNLISNLAKCKNQANSNCKNT